MFWNIFISSSFFVGAFASAAAPASLNLTESVASQIDLLQSQLNSPQTRVKMLESIIKCLPPAQAVKEVKGAERLRQKLSGSRSRPAVSEPTPAIENPTTNIISAIVAESSANAMRTQRLREQSDKLATVNLDSLTTGESLLPLVVLAQTVGGLLLNRVHSGQGLVPLVDSVDAGSTRKGKILFAVQKYVDAAQEDLHKQLLIRDSLAAITKDLFRKEKEEKAAELSEVDDMIESFVVVDADFERNALLDPVKECDLDLYEREFVFCTVDDIISS
jgi:hypothetical protein